MDRTQEVGGSSPPSSITKGPQMGPFCRKSRAPRGTLSVSGDRWERLRTDRMLGGLSSWACPPGCERAAVSKFEMPTCPPSPEEPLRRRRAPRPSQIPRRWEANWPSSAEGDLARQVGSQRAGPPEGCRDELVGRCSGPRRSRGAYIAKGRTQASNSAADRQHV